MPRAIPIDEHEGARSRQVDDAAEPFVAERARTADVAGRHGKRVYHTPPTSPARLGRAASFWRRRSRAFHMQARRLEKRLRAPELRRFGVPDRADLTGIDRSILRERHGRD